MERSRDYDDIAVALAEARPTPRPDFSAELDELVATGFPRDSRVRRAPLAALADRMRAISPQRLLFATSGTALASIVVATVVVASLDSGSEPVSTERQAARPQPQVQFSEPIPDVATRSKESSAASAQGSVSGTQSSSEVQSSDSLVPFSRSVHHRDIERSAEISLLAEPADVGDDSTQVFRAVHDARGIVLHSTTTAGRNAGARFELLIPSAQPRRCARRLLGDRRGRLAARGDDRHHRPDRFGRGTAAGLAGEDRWAPIAARRRGNRIGQGNDRSRAAPRAPPRHDIAIAIGATTAPCRLLARLAAHRNRRLERVIERRLGHR